MQEYKSIYKYYTEEYLEKLKVLKIDKKINNIKFIKYLNKDAKIIFEHDDYNNILHCVNHIKNYDITIKVNDKEKFNKYLFNYKINNNITIELPQCNYLKINKLPLKEYIEYEKILYKMVEKGKRLSPLEKYIYVYNVVKNFKKYKDSEEDPTESRDLYKILKNDYIVCVGYSYLLCDLLKKSGINSTDISVKLDSSYDDKDLNKVIPVNKEGHRRVYVYIKDEKYNIDGYYLSDPTWDNDMETDYYNHMLFTDNKNDSARDYQWLDKYMLFNVKNKYEFNKYFDLSNKFGFNSYYHNYKLSVTDFLIEIIKEIEPDYALYLKNKYKCILECFKVSKTNSNYEELLKLKDEIGEHIVSKVNNDIDELSKWKAIRSVYKKIYKYKRKWILDCQIKLLKIYNSEYEKYCFPERKLIR